jgi:hypothetical protein
MRTHLEFRSGDLLDEQNEDGEPRGAKVARLLADHLPAHVFETARVHAEDWGWRIQLANEPFPLWVGCGHYEEYPDGHLCFIEPSKPYVRRWLKRIPTMDTVERLATAMERIVQDSGKAHDLRWWTEAEVTRG